MERRLRGNLVRSGLLLGAAGIARPGQRAAVLGVAAGFADDKAVADEVLVGVYPHIPGPGVRIEFNCEVEDEGFAGSGGKTEAV